MIPYFFCSGRVGKIASDALESLAELTRVKYWVCFLHLRSLRKESRTGRIQTLSERIGLTWVTPDPILCEFKTFFI